MKKTFLIIFSLIILLALGVFSTQAFTYEAYSGSSTGGTTGASFFD
ncbi:MAG TPA: hypothetical protein P5052_03155 [Candidatus Paceibacterota bacterium]|nr:hypothetical protein [Candidatus Paceibacterota bacterium]HRZ29727.1 hypothetical protein [Candidatus Paceibacterota bacterium]